MYRVRRRSLWIRLSGGGGIDTHQPAKWTPLESPHNKNKTTCWRGGESKNREQKVGVVLLLLLHMARTKVSPSFHPLLLPLSQCVLPTNHAILHRSRTKRKVEKSLPWARALRSRGGEGGTRTQAHTHGHTHTRGGGGGGETEVRAGRSALGFLFGFSPPAMDTSNICVGLTTQESKVFIGGFQSFRFFCGGRTRMQISRNKMPVNAAILSPRIDGGKNPRYNISDFPSDESGEEN